jgi:hypothetical protein
MQAFPKKNEITNRKQDLIAEICYNTLKVKILCKRVKEIESNKWLNSL